MILRNILILFISLSFFSIHSQSKDVVLFSIDNEAVYTSEFLRVYNKNLSIVTDESQKDMKNYLDLFINYKLKVKQAYDLKFDTIQSYKTELKSYKKQLMEPFLKDESILDDLIKEAYDRSLLEINASHILVKMNPKDASSIAKSLTKIEEIRAKIVAGENFETAAKQYSQDPSAKKNAGNLGYFSVFNMVYPFETAAYATNVGEVSKAFKTNFGYHIVQVQDKRKARGEVEAAHIMMKGNSKESEAKILEIYIQLENGADFGNIAKNKSEDTYTAKKEGSLGRFGSGRMLKEFEDVAFSLANSGDFSKPFKTQYGWHIIKLINKFPVESFDKVKQNIAEKIKRGDRSKSMDYSIVHKLKKQYDIKINQRALLDFRKKDENKKMTKTLMTIEGKEINQKKLADHLKGNDLTNEVWNSFKDNEILDYYKKDIEGNNQEFKNTYQEYREGLLLFEILQNKIWDKSKDSLGIQKFFDSNSKNYILEGKMQELNTIKGKVASDYQEFLEKEWLKELHARYTVVMNDEIVEKVIK